MGSVPGDFEARRNGGAFNPNLGIFRSSYVTFELLCREHGIGGAERVYTGTESRRRVSELRGDDIFMTIIWQ